MEQSKSTTAQRIAEVAKAFERERTGHMPGAVTVVLSGELLVIVLHDALSQAEKILLKTPSGGVQVENFHAQLFAMSVEALRREVERNTGIKLLEPPEGGERSSGPTIRVLETGTTVQILFLAQEVATEMWSDR